MDQEIRLKRLRYRSWHRGCKETDVILGHFADTQLAGLSPDMTDLFEQLLEENDNDIWNWLTDKAPYDAQYQPLITMLKAIEVSAVQS